MADCKVCVKSLKNTKLKIECSDCKGLFHGKCVDLTSNDIEYFSSEDELWRCKPCSKSRRQSMRLETVSDGVTYEDMLAHFQALRDDFKMVEQSLGKSINSCHEQIKEHIDLSRAQNEKIQALTSMLEQAVAENVTLKKVVSALESRLDEAEQYNRKNSFEIHGIPQNKRNETTAETIDIVKKVGEALGFPIEDSMIDACHRLRKTTADKPAGIIVKMVRRLDTEAILEKRRMKKREFSTRHLGFQTDDTIYLNESLSPARRRLLYHAKQAKSEKGYKYLWIRGGRILLRRNDGEDVIVITNKDQLDSL